MMSDIPSSSTLVGAKEENSNEKDKKSSSDTDFECNICLEVATKPVVTPCGHLFCWPCLYQWLRRPRSRRECPLCKGRVSESNIIPIYGRGDSETFVDKLSDLNIPPRSRGRRTESSGTRGNSVMTLEENLEQVIDDTRRLLDSLTRHHVRNPQQLIREVL